MTDDLTKRGPKDRTRINIHEPWEVTYWTKTLGVSEKKLKLAVNTVGVMVKDVKQWLADN
ncbi:DUF3606 domain-containing protein [Mariprofundus ferrooxydans]|uniref:DUF3606 domain-containing protein n=1 Tax=Mariprofundus ferrooxydans TaxID=314344 RepID=UPI0006A6C9BF|nr:DUF3606 domain-containing protein [Mariprofundus ferrooxydans]KON48562.1 hypothetical protein AL013_02750 [Mariprofundus ferrooxydans]